MHLANIAKMYGRGRHYLKMCICYCNVGLISSDVSRLARKRKGYDTDELKDIVYQLFKVAEDTAAVTIFT